MFEPGLDQAAGLRREAGALRAGPALLPVASPEPASSGFEWPCRLALALSTPERALAVIDACASERGTQGGLVHALGDSAPVPLGAGAARGEWLVMPGAQGLQSLLTTARVAGADTALARLLAPFASDVLVLLYAPAPALATLLGGLHVPVLVPLTDAPQASIGAYGAIKGLHGAGLGPVLAPLQAHAQVLHNVRDCAQRHLGLSLSVWPENDWARRAPEAATLLRETDPLGADCSAAQGLCAGAAPVLWS